MFKDKKVLVTGSEGLIGKELVEQLEELGANVYGFDIKKCDDFDVTYKCELEQFFDVAGPFDYVFHLFGIKGSPKRTREKPIDFMYPMIAGDANVIYLAQKYGVKKMLYTSSITVKYPEVDKFPAWAKSTGEFLIEAMRVQYPKGTEYCIVRPASVYGRFDNFGDENSMVVTALIDKALKGDFEVWGDGSEERDFINSKDVARGMIQAMEEMPEEPVTLCSGKCDTIKKIVEVIEKETGSKAIFNIDKKIGAQKRVMDINWNFKPLIEIEEGIKETIKWIKKQQ